MWADIVQHKPTTSMACGRHPGNVMIIKGDGDVGDDGDDDDGDDGDVDYHPHYHDDGENFHYRGIHIIHTNFVT